jgi:1-pyrroline-4-hydroxy-2-carboxylate deaminase
MHQRMDQRHWAGVLPAITTPLLPDGAVDHGFLAEHVAWLIDNGCQGIVALGSLGEAATLTFDEKVAILETCVRSVGARVPVVAGIAGLATGECVALAREAERVGCAGLMALPAYVYVSDWHETRAHYEAVLRATSLSCMLYNNPVAYKTDVTAPQLAELAAAHPNLHAVKESAGDARRVSAIKEAVGERLSVLVGMDDMVLEGVAVGAVGWVAGLVNALPAESVLLFELARGGRWAEATTLYHWFLPLLRLDTVPKFVQLIKLVQAEVGMGSETVRAPRLVVEGAEREEVLALIRRQLAARPEIPTPTPTPAPARGNGAGNGAGSGAAVGAGAAAM